MAKIRAAQIMRGDTIVTAGRSGVERDVLSVTHTRGRVLVQFDRGQASLAPNAVVDVVS